MQFPSEWSEKKIDSLQQIPQGNGNAGNSGHTGKRRKVNIHTAVTTMANSREELKSLLSQCDAQHTLETSQNINPDYDDSIVGLIKRQVNNTRFAPATPEELQLDHVLSSVPYRDMLESLFGTVSGQAPNLPIITKAYEESFMREALPGERQCAMGSKCECMFIDQNSPFIGVEFELPNDDAKTDTSADMKAQTHKKSSSMDLGMRTSASIEPKLCVLCSRKTTQKLFYDACYSGTRIQGLIQRFGNLCNQPGEYARDCMLICPPSAQWHCLPLPIMSHQRNRYRVQVVAGIKHLQQLRVSYEDFFVTPSGRNV
jgi:hypothetical protein